MKKRRLTIDKVWNKFAPLVKDILMDVYGNKCVTCSKEELIGRDKQLGHFFPKGAYSSVRWWILNLGIQCSYCNGAKQGATLMFSEWFRKTHGQQALDDITVLAHKSHSTSQYEYELIIEKVKEYEKMIKSKEITYKQLYKKIIDDKFGLFIRS